MTIEIVDFPIKNGGSFHSYVTVYQRVSTEFTALQLEISWLHGEQLLVIFVDGCSGIITSSKIRHEQMPLIKHGEFFPQKMEAVLWQYL